jgi:hypothetical protein
MAGRNAVRTIPLFCPQLYEGQASSVSLWALVIAPIVLTIAN